MFLISQRLTLSLLSGQKCLLNRQILSNHGILGQSLPKSPNLVLNLHDNQNKPKYIKVSNLFSRLRNVFKSILRKFCLALIYNMCTEPSRNRYFPLFHRIVDDIRVWRIKVHLGVFLCGDSEVRMLGRRAGRQIQRANNIMKKDSPKRVCVNFC